MPQERNHLCLARDVVLYYRAADGALVCARARAWTLWERAAGHVYGWKRTFVRAACARVPRSVCAFGRVLIWTQGSTCVFMRIGKEVEALGSSLPSRDYFFLPPRFQYAHSVQLPGSVSPSRSDLGSGQRVQDTKAKRPGMSQLAWPP